MKTFTRLNAWLVTAAGLGLGLAIAPAAVASAGTAQSAAPTTASHQAGAVRPALVPPFTCGIVANNTGRYLSAVDGGGRTTNVIRTNEKTLRSWEKFTFIDSGDGSNPVHYGIRTDNLHYLTAVGGGGYAISPDGTDAVHSNAPNLDSWEKFSLISRGNGLYALQTINGHFITATGGGNQTSDAIHANATAMDSWELFRLDCI
jgi:hypothetical protein